MWPGITQRCHPKYFVSIHDLGGCTLTPSFEYPGWLANRVVTPVRPISAKFLRPVLREYRTALIPSLFLLISSISTISDRRLNRILRYVVYCHC
jgi:hypothetical protein